MSTPADYLELARSQHRDELRRLARCPYPFVWRAVAANPHTPPDVLRELSEARDSPYADNELLRLLAVHPRADRDVLKAVLAATAAKLTEGERPYAAVLALADRAELNADDIQGLGALRGASARLRRGLARHLDTRTSGPRPQL